MSRDVTGSRGFVRLVGLALGCLLLGACSASSSRDADEGLSDPFFREGISDGTGSLDEVLEGNAPSVGWLSGPRDPEDDPAEEELLGRERSAAGAGEVVEAERNKAARDRGEEIVEDDDPEGGTKRTGRGRQKTFSEKAQEATLSTMSVLLSAGMVALPFLLGS